MHEHICIECGSPVVRTGTRGYWPRRCPEHRAARKAQQNRANVSRWQRENHDRYIAYQTEYRKKHAPENRARAAAWYEQNKDRANLQPSRQVEAKRPNYRKYMLKSRYGLTVDDFDAMRAAQDFRCAICGRHEDDLPVRYVGARRRDGDLPRSEERLCIDHDHATGNIRALLCQNCNSAIGHFRDSPDLLCVAAAYLEFHRSFVAD